LLVKFKIDYNVYYKTEFKKLMEYEYLMNVASILYIICYIPELYANY